jgi:hypothetical protein
MTKSNARAQRRRAQAGASLLETLFTVFIGTLILGGTVACMVGAASSADRAQTFGGLQTQGRKATDELLYELRGASAVLASQTLAATAYTTSASTIVFSGPGLTLDASSNPDVLSAITDYYAFSYDSNGTTLYETIVPGTGSVRPTRTRMVMAKNVSAFSLTYKVRDQYKATSTGSYSHALLYAATATPTAYVNGAMTTCTLSGQTATISSVTSGADVEFVYPVSPTNTSALASVTQVDATITMQQVSGKAITRTITLNGTARLRNVRL